MHLTEDNLCSIYETRPVVCNVEKTYEVYFARVMSKQEFEQMNRKICITLQEK
jgi:Fe-S-cluster containining protein